MSRREMTLIYYHVLEDKDDPDTPNIFAVPLPKEELRLGHIRQHFPLKGSYVFRFKMAYEGLVVWLDLPHLASQLPMFKEQVVVRANRITWKDGVENYLQTVPKESSQSKQKPPPSHSNKGEDLI